MKKQLIILALPFLAACSPQPKQATVAGKIVNYSGSVVYVESKGVIDTLKVTDGTFVLKKQLLKPQMFTMRFDRNAVAFYMVPGDSTYFEYNLSERTPIFSADNSKLMQNISVINSTFNGAMAQWRDIFALEQPAFKGKMDSLQTKVSSLLDSAKGESKELLALETARIKYGILGLMVRYPQMNAYITQKEIKADDVDLSIFGDFNPNNAEHLMFADYCGLVSQYVNLKVNKLDDYKKVAELSTDQKLPVQFKLIDSLVIMDPVVRDYVKMTILDEELMYGEFYKLTDIVNGYVAECKAPEYVTMVQTKFNEMMCLAPGKPAPAIVAKDIKDKDVTLEQFKGSLVYIDFWTTWCGPCRGELPHLEKLQDEYKGKKVVFISLSLDDDKAAWEKMVKDNKMKGVQLHATGAWRSDAAVSYKIKGVPTFYLIDADGNILSPCAPRPSSAEIRPLFDAELAKIPAK